MKTHNMKKIIAFICLSLFALEMTAQIQGLTRQRYVTVDSLNTIDSLKLALPGHMYQASDSSVVYFGANDSSLIGPIKYVPEVRYQKDTLIIGFDTIVGLPEGNPNAQPILARHYRRVDRKTAQMEEVNGTAQAIGKLLNTELSSGRTAYQDAELVYIPDNSDSLTSYSQKGGDFDFSRPSIATEINNEGLIDSTLTNWPRVEFSKNQQRAGLLIEKLDTNLFTNSNDFQTNWFSSGLNFSENHKSPDDNFNATKLIATANNTQHRNLRTTQIDSGYIYAYSFFVKPSGYDFINVVLPGCCFEFDNYVYFDLVNGIIGSTKNSSGHISEVGNGYYRIYVFSMSITDGSGSGGAWVSDQDYGVRTPSFLGDGTSGVIFYGSEFLKYLDTSSVGSYIPSGSSQGIRQPDSLYQAINLGDSTGTIVVDAATDNDTELFRLYGSDTTKVIRLTDTLRLVTAADTTTIQEATELDKIALSYDSDSIFITVNEGETVSKIVAYTQDYNYFYVITQAPVTYYRFLMYEFALTESERKELTE